MKPFSNSNQQNKNVVSTNKSKYSNYTIVAKQAGRMSNFQLEAIKRFLKRYLKKKAQIYFRVFPNISMTKKPNDVRLGRGKGNVTY